MSLYLAVGVKVDHETTEKRECIVLYCINVSYDEQDDVPQFNSRCFQVLECYITLNTDLRLGLPIPQSNHRIYNGLYATSNSII